MSDNVLEQLVGEWMSLRDESTTQGEWDSLSDCASALESRLNPCRYMPPLSEWPEGAEWCAVDADRACCFYKEDPRRDKYIWLPWTNVNRYVDIPLGIDWRTLKASRKQMEEYEDGTE